MAYITDPAELIEDLRSQEFDDAADMIERLMAENAKLREICKTSLTVLCAVDKTYSYTMDHNFAKDVSIAVDGLRDVLRKEGEQ